MKIKLEKLIEEKEDKVRIYRLDKDYKKDVTIIGQGEISEDKDYYIL